MSRTFLLPMLVTLLAHHVSLELYRTMPKLVSSRSMSASFFHCQQLKLVPCIVLCYSDTIRSICTTRFLARWE